MAEALEVSSTEDCLPAEWKPFSRRSRKSGCSNIFSGVNLHQLHKLFRTAGDRNAEHRAKLVWQDVEGNPEGAEEGKQSEEEQEPLAVYSVEDNADQSESLETFKLPADEDITGNQNPFKPSSWRLGIRMESARDSERYLHRILH
uniref:Arginine vasopressin-induced protein 1 n=1 Tax=Xiphophorus couchianus TaxID=32473 RepID=A0A3B5M734_9TELE